MGCLEEVVDGVRRLGILDGVRGCEGARGVARAREREEVGKEGKEGNRGSAGQGIGGAIILSEFLSQCWVDMSVVRLV